MILHVVNSDVARKFSCMEKMGMWHTVLREKKRRIN